MFSAKDWASYFGTYKDLLSHPSIIESVTSMSSLLHSTSQNKGTVMFFGNGASASLASHAALDFTKQAKVRAQVFHDPSYLTAISNDAGFDNWIVTTLDFYSKPNDCVVFISVSGESECLLRGAQKARELGLKVVTLTGKNPDNSLSQLGDLNVHIPSHAYNIVEGLHSILLTGCIDSIVGKSVYDVAL